MRKLLFTLFALAFAISVFAQDKKDAKTKKAKTPKSETAWKGNGSISVLGGFGSSKDHYSGLSSSGGFVYGGYLKLYAAKNWGRNTWTNSFVGGYLRTSSSDEENNLNENKIEVYSRYGYKLKNEKWQLGVVGNVRTQIVSGYDYSYASRKRTSGFFAPAFITLSTGTNIALCKDLNVFIGPAVRWVTVTNRPYSLNYQGGIKPDGSPEPTLASLYNVDPQKQVRYETGAYISAMWKKEFNKKITVKTRLDLMNDFREQPDNFDVYWTTGIGVNLGKWFTIAGNFDLIYDQDIRRKLMYRGMAGVGAICRF